MNLYVRSHGGASLVRE